MLHALAGGAAADTACGRTGVEVSVIVPVLDEERSVHELAERTLATLNSAGLDFEILFVDDGSRDGTAARVDAVIRAHGNVRLVRLGAHRGKSAAIAAGVEASRGRTLVTMDGDLQDLPEEIPRLLADQQARGLDVVCGWRRDRRDAPARRLASLAFNRTAELFFRAGLHDWNCGLKAFRREVLEQMPARSGVHRFYPALSRRRGFSVGELAVGHRPRVHGKSRYGWGRPFAALRDLVLILLAERRAMRRSSAVRHLPARHTE